MIGTNNSGNNTSREIADGVEVIVKQLRKNYPTPKCYCSASFAAPNADKRRQVNEGANAIFKKLPTARRALPRHRPEFPRERRHPLARIMPDLLHLSEKGYTICRIYRSKAEELMGEWE